MLAGIITFTLALGIFFYIALPAGRWRIAGITVYIALLALIWGGSAELLGQPKPIKLEWFRNLAGSPIIAVMPVEDVAIYVLILRDGKPVLYVLAWNVKDAEGLQDGVKRIGEEGGQLVLGPAIDRVPDAPLNGELSKVIPPAALPPKG